LTTKEIIGIFADVLINIGLSKTGAESISYQELVDYLHQHRKTYGETPENALIAQGLLMQTWYSNKGTNNEARLI
jgi:hypothetical protein